MGHNEIRRRVLPRVSSRSPRVRPLGPLQRTPSRRDRPRAAEAAVALCLLQIDRRSLALLATLEVIGQLLSLAQIADPGALYRGDVDEDIF